MSAHILPSVPIFQAIMPRRSVTITYNSIKLNGGGGGREKYIIFLGLKKNP